MFTPPRQLVRQSGPYAIGRLTYLRQLVAEFRSPAVGLDSRRQVLANLANFAYDPVNFDFLRHLNVVPGVLTDCLLDEADPLLRRFALAGVANCCPDPANARLLLGAGLLTRLRRLMLTFATVDEVDGVEVLRLCLTVLGQLLVVESEDVAATVAEAVVSDAELCQRLRLLLQLDEDSSDEAPDAGGNEQRRRLCQRNKLVSNLARVVCMHLGVG